MSVQVYIGADSPLLTYTATGGSWTRASGRAECSGTTSGAVELDSTYFSAATFFWTASSSFTISAGIDGSLSTGSTSAGQAQLQSSFGSHSARLEVSCPQCADSDQFALQGVIFETETTSTGSGSNSTLDDASSAITYSGFTSTGSSGSSIQEIEQGTFYDNTVSYTSTSGASATFSFSGSALYVFGMTGPSFGLFTVAVDSGSSSTYNACTSADTYDTLLYFVTGLDDSTHDIVLTAGGGLFAFDYAVAVSGSSSTTASSPSGTASAGGSAVFPSQTGSTSSGSAATTTGPGDTGAIVGGVLGTLGGLFLLYVWWRYRAYRKAGGEGDCFVALCGKWERDAPPQAKNEENTFKPWAYLRYQPKYAKEDS